MKQRADAKSPIAIDYVTVAIQPDYGPQGIPALVVKFPTGRSVSLPLGEYQNQRIRTLNKASRKHVEKLLADHRARK